MIGRKFNAKVIVETTLFGKYQKELAELLETFRVYPVRNQTLVAIRVSLPSSLHLLLVPCPFHCSTPEGHGDRTLRWMC